MKTPKRCPSWQSITGALARICRRDFALLALSLCLCLVLGCAFGRRAVHPVHTLLPVAPHSSEGIVVKDGEVYVHLNTADEKTLQTLPGIGPTLARRIIDYREEHGPFASLEDLLLVQGIGEKRLSQIADHIAVEIP